MYAVDTEELACPRSTVDSRNTMPIYFAKRALPNQVVSPEASALGLRYVRQRPADFPVPISARYSQPGFSESTWGTVEELQVPVLQGS